MTSDFFLCHFRPSRALQRELSYRAVPSPESRVPWSFLTRSLLSPPPSLFSFRVLELTVRGLSHLHHNPSHMPAKVHTMWAQERASAQDTRPWTLTEHRRRCTAVHPYPLGDIHRTLADAEQAKFHFGRRITQPCAMRCVRCTARRIPTEYGSTRG